MEPISMMIMMGAGLALQGAGMYTSMGASKTSNEAKQQEIQLQQKVEEQRRIAMELDARRKRLENVRQVQRARSLALTNATSQGAGQGSGLQGGFAQIAAQGAWNDQGIAQNLEIGRNVFGLNQQISQQRMIQAQAGSDLALGQGLSSLGSSLMSAAPAFGRLASGFGPSSTPAYNPMAGYNKPGGMGFIH